MGFLSKQSALTFLFWCLISCLEAEGDSSVISIRVGKRERVLQIEVMFFEFVFGKIMFWIPLFLVGVLSDYYDNMSYYYDVLVCIFFAY